MIANVVVVQKNGRTSDWNIPQQSIKHIESIRIGLDSDEMTTYLPTGLLDKTGREIYLESDEV